MTYRGIDTAAKISAAAAKELKAAGISFAGRYLVPPGMSKELTAALDKITKRVCRFTAAKIPAGRTGK